MAIPGNDRGPQWRPALRLAAALTLLAVAITAYLRPAPTAPGTATDATALRGEPINSPAPVAAAATNEAVATNAPSKRRRPQPESFQKRIVKFHASKSSGAAGDESDFIKPQMAPRPVPQETLEEATDAQISGYQRIGFDRLAGFPFEVTDAIVDATRDPKGASAATRQQIPPAVLALDGAKAAIRGFLIPLRMEDGRAVEFLLMRDQNLCCFGKVPNLHEWISVAAPRLAVKPDMDRPITVLGTLRVGEQRENGYLVGIYRLDADKVIAPGGR